MVLAAILWVCALPQTDDLGKFSAALKANGERQTLSVTPFDSTSRDSIVRAASPSAPEPKVTSEAEPAVLRLSAEPVQPVRATAGRPGESPRQRKTWYGLMAAAHAAACGPGVKSGCGVRCGHQSVPRLPLPRAFAGPSCRCSDGLNGFRRQAQHRRLSLGRYLRLRRGRRCCSNDRIS